MVDVVFGATGMIGSYIVEGLERSGRPVLAVSRQQREFKHAECVVADLTRGETLAFPNPETVFCATNARTFAEALPHILRSNPKRVIVISSASLFSKLDSSDEEERNSFEELARAEMSIVENCQSAAVQWTILRPSLIYREGHDRNVTQISKVVRALRFMPLYGNASGLRQPVHAEDLAMGAIAAARSVKAANKSYFTTGIETLSYREMAGRVFDGLSMPRRLVPLSPIVWKAAFALSKPLYPGVTVAMGERMLRDLAFDSSAAVSDFGWSTRTFAPSFG
jgi:nucleoside-diphosphate-sugar epimerase